MSRVCWSSRRASRRDRRLCCGWLAARSSAGSAIKIQETALYKSLAPRVALTSADFAVIDLRLPGGSGLSLVKRLGTIAKDVRMVVLTGFGSIATTVSRALAWRVWLPTRAVSVTS